MRAKEISKAGRVQNISQTVELGFYAKNNVNPAEVFQRGT